MHIRYFRTFKTAFTILQRWRMVQTVLYVLKFGSFLTHIVVCTLYDKCNRLIYLSCCRQNRRAVMPAARPVNEKSQQVALLLCSGIDLETDSGLFFPHWPLGEPANEKGCEPNKLGVYSSLLALCIEHQHHVLLPRHDYRWVSVLWIEFSSCRGGVSAGSRLL